MENPTPNIPATVEDGNSQPQAGGPHKAPKLDLSRLSPPENLEETRLEPFTIDGICGVY